MFSCVNRRLLFSLALLPIASPGFAASHYVLSSAKGSGTGADWTNACTDFSGSCAEASLVRGDTYYVGSGKYAARTFDAGTSGSLVITIKGATVADHGSSTGWSNSFSVSPADGGSQAIWSIPILFKSSYWVFNGQVGSMVRDASQYGFRVNVNSCASPAAGYSVGVNGSPTTSVSIQHVAVVQCGASYDDSQDAFAAGAGAQEITNATFQHVYALNSNACFELTNIHDSTFDHWLCDSNWGSASNHGDVININVTVAGLTKRDTWRYGAVVDTTPTSMTGTFIALGPGLTCPMDTWYIYGNYFKNNYGGNGTIAAGGDTLAICNTLVYNNTIVDNGPAFFRQCETGAAACSSASGNVLRNNLFYNSDVEINPYNGSAIDEDYDSFISATTTPNSEAHGQVAKISGVNLFSNYSGGVYTPVQAPGISTNQINPGVALPAPYNLDPNGVVRGSSGSWARGAFEFSSGITTQLNPGTNLTATSH